VLRLADVQGHPAALALLSRAIEAGRLPPALLFHGPEGVGKACLAHALASALICEQPCPAACGRCRSCRMLEHGTHPDLVHVSRLEKNEDTDHLVPEHPDVAEADLRGEILVDQVRHLLEFVPLLPRAGRHRVVIVDPAERLNDEAQNALLKTLEEPPARSTIVLVSASPHRLLPTVRSRCFAVGLRPLPPAELSRILVERGVPPAEAASRAVLAGGRLGAALSLDLAARRSRRDELLALLSRLATDRRAIGELPERAQELAGSNERSLVEGLDLVEGLLRDAARVASRVGAAGLMHADATAGLQRLAAGLGAPRAAELVAACERVRLMLRYNTNRSLIAEALLAAAAGGPLP
jgi:DNA polymerase-3 subunit delta'